MVARREGHPVRKKHCFNLTFMSTTINPMAISPRQPLSGRMVLRIPGLDRRAHEVRDGKTLRVCTVNVNTFRGRGPEIVDMLRRRRADICCIQEVRYKADNTNNNVCVIRAGDAEYKLFYAGNNRGTGGVGILMTPEMGKSIQQIERHNDRIITVKTVWGGSIYHIFSVYAPQAGLPISEKLEFWENLEDIVSRIPERDGVLIAGDLNGHIGSDSRGFEEVMGRHGYGTIDDDGSRILNFCKNQNMRITNTLFQKDRERMITYKSGRAETQIDFILYRRKRQLHPKDCSVIPGEACLPQHRLLKSDFVVTDYRKRRWRGLQKVKVWKLRDESTRSDFQAKVAEVLSNRDCSDWTTVQSAIHGACADVCGVTSGRRGKQRETWWWCPAVQQAVKNKKAAFNTWQRSGQEVHKQIYRNMNKITKKAVSTARVNATRACCGELSTAEGKMKVYKMAKQMKRDKSDISGANFIKDEDDNILVDEGEVADRWRRYYNILLNSENQSRFEQVPKVEGPIPQVTSEEVRQALMQMKLEKAAGPSGVTSDMFRHAGDLGISVLTSVFRRAMDEERTPTEWANSLTVPLFKGKGDSLLCDKYRGLRLLEHAMKIWERVLLARLRPIIGIDAQQFGFLSGKSTTDAIYIARQLQEKYGAKKTKLYHIFVDLEKAFDKIPRNAITWALRRKGVPERLVRLVQALYHNSTSCVKVSGTMSAPFPIQVGVHQGSALSPILFITILDAVTETCRSGAPWELLYADDLVLSAETMDEVVGMFDDWRVAMESKGLKVNIDKTKLLISGKRMNTQIRVGNYPCGVCGRGVMANSILCVGCNRWVHQRCSGIQRGRLSRHEGVFRCRTCTDGSPPADESITTSGGIIEDVEQFCYLGNILSRDCHVERAIRARVAAAWKKWRDIGSLLCNRGIHLKVRAAVYDACIRSVLLYGSETWPMTQQLGDIVRHCDRRMLRLVTAATGRRMESRVLESSESILRVCGLPDITHVMKRNRLRYFGHVCRREEEDPLSVVRRHVAPGRVPPGRPKMTWETTLEQDLEDWNMSGVDVRDRADWRSRLMRRLTPP